MADTYKHQEPEIALKMARRVIKNNALRRKQKSLDLSDYGLESLPIEIGLLTDLITLNLDGNKLIDLPAEIGAMTSLRSLSVRNNQLYSIPSNIGELHNLEELYLDSNYLEKLPFEISFCSSLQELHLSSNHFSALPTGVVECESLVHLNLQENKISNLPSNFDRLQALKELRLANNVIRDLPQSIQSLPELKFLDLNGNELRSIDNNFSSLQSLESLYLSQNEFREFPHNITNLRNLRYLDISRNEIKIIPEDLGFLTSLLALDVSNNDLSSIPDAVSRLHSLQSFSCAGNFISQLPAGIENLKNIAYLDIARNHFTDFPSEISNLSSLISLQFDDNMISEIPSDIVQLKKLIYLSFSSNNVGEITPRIGDLANLQTLNASNNNISVIPEAFGNLNRIWSLQLRGNRLNDLPRSLGVLKFQPYLSTSEWGLHLIDNPLSSPLSDIVGMGQPVATWNILKYLRDQPLVDVPSRQEDLEDVIRNKRPPEIPNQANGPHFELDDNNVVNFAPPEAIDADGNNIARLSRLHPTLVDIGLELGRALGRGNIPLGLLRDRFEAYRRVIDRNLETIDFGQLYVEGVRLANAARAAFNDTELPALPPDVRELADTLLQLHGTFILSTAEGLESIASEERYGRTPQEEKAYRLIAEDFAEQLQNNPTVIDPVAAKYIYEVSTEIGQGGNIERSGIIATGTIKNVAVTLTAAAALGAVTLGAVASGSPILVLGATASSLIGIEGLKKSKAFITVAGLVTKSLDAVVDRDSESIIHSLSQKLSPQLAFVRHIEPKLRKLAQEREEFRWIEDLMDWINHSEDEA